MPGKRGIPWVVMIAGIGILGAVPSAFSHCEIPCGIYADQMRVVMIAEDITTIEKSMTEINRLSKEGDKNYNQLVRWIVNKDEHAVKIQEVVYQYFMTQRLKITDPKDEAAYKKYLSQLVPLHELLVYAMKCKQTTDLENCEKLRKALEAFQAAYFSAEDLKHIQEHHGEHSK